MDFYRKNTLLTAFFIFSVTVEAANNFTENCVSVRFYIGTLYLLSAMYYYYFIGVVTY